MSNEEPRESKSAIRPGTVVPMARPIARIVNLAKEQLEQDEPNIHVHTRELELKEVGKQE